MEMQTAQAIQGIESVETDGISGWTKPESLKPSNTSNVIDLRRRTQDMIGVLEVDQLQKVYTFTASLMEEDNDSFKFITKEQVLADLDTSEEDIKMGRVKDAHQAMNDIRKRLGMSVDSSTSVASGVNA